MGTSLVVALVAIAVGGPLIAWCLRRGRTESSEAHHAPPPGDLVRFPVERTRPPLPKHPRAEANFAGCPVPEVEDFIPIKDRPGTSRHEDPAPEGGVSSHLLVGDGVAYTS